MKIVKTASGKKKIKISKEEWQDIGKKTGWMKISNRTRYYLETWIDGQQMLGSDGTVVFLEENPSKQKLNNAVQRHIQKLIGLSKNIMPETIKNCGNIILKFVKSYGNENTTLQEIDVTDHVKNDSGINYQQ
jgi:hypothetical protein